MIVAAAIPPATDQKLSGRVLELLKEAPRPIGAYAIARRIDSITGQSCHANSVYRVLDRLMAEGQVVAVRSLKGWMINRQPADARTIVLLCTDCGLVSQIPASMVETPLRQLLQAQRFELSQLYLEVPGRCKTCSASKMQEA